MNDITGQLKNIHSKLRHHYTLPELTLTEMPVVSTMYSVLVIPTAVKAMHIVQATPTTVKLLQKQRVPLPRSS